MTSILSDAEGSVCELGPDGSCITCADQGVHARVIATQPAQATATVESAGTQFEVATDLLDAVAVGDWVLVHAGFAIARLEGVEA